VSLCGRTDALGQDLNSSLFNNNGADNDFQIEMNGDDPGLYRYNGTGGSGLFGPATTEWVHLAMSCDGTTTNIYYNGLFVTSLDQANTQYGQIAMGINRGMANWFEGEVDEVRVYNRALSDAEIAGLAGLTETLPASF
jgi:Concanavalin A-like lectin/glucanases superfamily